MSTHNLCFEQKHEKYENFLSENFHSLVVKFSVYLNRHVITKTCLFKYILKILPPKNENFQIKSSNIFHISPQNIDCGYSLEPPR